MVAAWSGRPRRRAPAAMIEAFCICSGVSTKVCGAAMDLTEHVGADELLRGWRSPTATMTAAVKVTAPSRTRRPQRGRRLVPDGRGPFTPVPVRLGWVWRIVVFTIELESASVPAAWGGTPSAAPGARRRARAAVPWRSAVSRKSRGASGATQQGPPLQSWRTSTRLCRCATAGRTGSRRRSRHRRLQ